MERESLQRNLYVIGRFKDEIMKILKCNKDFQLVALGKEYDMSDLSQKQQLKKDFEESSSIELYDYAFVPNTETGTKIYVCVDVDVPYVDGVTFKDLYVHFYVFTPKNYVSWDKVSQGDLIDTLYQRGYCGNKIDVLTDIIDRELNGRHGMVIGKLRLADNNPVSIFNYVDGHYGKQLIYYGTDFNVLPRSALNDRGDDDLS